MTPEERLARLGITIPSLAPPVANYVPARRAGNLLFVSGQLPMVAGALAYKGLVGRDVSVEDARDAARVCAINLLAAARSAVGNLSLIEVVRVEGFVACGGDFTEHPMVINGASDLLVEALGDKGRHSRTAVGMSSLPLGAPVEIAATFLIHE
jgi:enamine deaminase RidA (YjgF/YER057c/UK114 family)